MREDPHLFTVAEAAAFLKRDRATLYRIIRAGEWNTTFDGVPLHRIGRRLAIPEKALRRWVDGEIGQGIAS